METKVLFFGATADIVGSRELYVPHVSEMSALIEQLVAEYPRLASHKLLVSINQEYASHHSPINDGDEVAIFTAVSGG